MARRIPMEIPDTNSTAVRREAYYKTIAGSHLVPLWERISTLVPMAPRPAALPVSWRFAGVRPHLLEAGQLLTTEEVSQSLEWEENDSFVVPSWVSFRLHAEKECIVFNFSDRAAQEKLGIWREERSVVAW